MYLKILGCSGPQCDLWVGHPCYIAIMIEKYTSENGSLKKKIWNCCGSVDLTCPLYCTYLDDFRSGSKIANKSEKIIFVS